MQAFFLERPLYLVPVLVLIQLILISHWLRSRTSKSAKRVVIAAAVFATLIGLQAAVETDRERIGAVCRQLAGTVEKANPMEFAGLLAPEIVVVRRQGDPLDREGLIDRFRALLRVYRVEDARLRQINVEVSGAHATVDFHAVCRVLGPTERYPSVMSHWKLEFDRLSGEWKLSTLRQGTLDPVDLDLLSEVF